MLISIVIPVYNVQEYLPGCIDSVLRNDLTDCEVILVDDGSPDGSGAICDSYAARNPETISVIHQENGGLGAARNTGIAAAKGDWLLFLDSDDTLTSDALTVLKAAIRPEIQVIGFQLYSDDGTGRLTPFDNPFSGTSKPFLLSERQEYLLCMPSAATRLWSRELFTASGIRFPSRVWYEDIRTTTKLLCLATGILVLPNRLYCYLQRPGSIMSNQNLDRNREIMDAFDDILDWYQEQGLRERFAQALCALTVEHVLLAASVRVARVDPRHALLKAFRDYTDQSFPGWSSNCYLRTLSRQKRLALRLIKGRHFKLLFLLFRMKG